MAGTEVGRVPRLGSRASAARRADVAWPSLPSPLSAPATRPVAGLRRRSIGECKWDAAVGPESFESSRDFTAPVAVQMRRVWQTLICHACLGRLSAQTTYLSPLASRCGPSVAARCGGLRAVGCHTKRITRSGFGLLFVTPL